MICVPTVWDLFGPVDGAAALSQVLPGGVFGWPGSCDTAHIAVFPAGGVLAPLYRAFWRMCFSQPVGRSLFRLVTCLDGPSALTPIATIDSNNKPPGIMVWNTGQDVTAQLNAFFAQNPASECCVGWQVAGDNANPFTVYSVRLELTWQIG